MQSCLFMFSLPLEVVIGRDPDSQGKRMVPLAWDGDSNGHQASFQIEGGSGFGEGLGGCRPSGK